MRSEFEVELIIVMLVILNDLMLIALTSLQLPKLEFEIVKLVILTMDVAESKLKRALLEESVTLLKKLL